ncbi:MAG TPA: hypothetical protein VII38_04745 [Polyangia bacterium]
MRPYHAWILAVLLTPGCGPAGGRGPGHGSGPGSSTSGDGGSTPGGGGPSGPTFSSMCNGAPTTLSGAVMAPNGVDPVANAFAYVPLSMGAFPAGVSCDLCDQPIDGSAAQAVSGPDGSFKLDLSNLAPSAQVAISVAKGRFRRTGMVAVTPCQDNPIGAPSTVLPGKAQGSDEIPKIAVATGNKDQLDAVLAAMGLDKSVGFDCYEGRASSTTTLTSPCGSHGTLPAIETLLTDGTKLDTYNMLFLSCAPGKFKSLSAQDQTTIAANLVAWTQKGGRLFVTDNSYDYLAQAFPNAITFLNGNATVDAANVGVGGTTSMPASYTGRINDATLAAWLTAVSVLPHGSNTITLSGYLSKWSVVQSVPMSTVDEVDATDAVAYQTGTTTPGTAMTYPQSIQFDITPPGGSAACGRAIYTSYHTLPSTMAVDATELAPQERILEYLMFEAGACVGTIG